VRNARREGCATDVPQSEKAETDLDIGVEKVVRFTRRIPLYNVWCSSYREPDVGDNCDMHDDFNGARDRTRHACVPVNAIQRACVAACARALFTTVAWLMCLLSFKPLR
jgi:hypothetical protein